MKRPLFIVAIGLIIGILIGLYYKIGIALFFILITYFIIKRIYSNKAIRYINVLFNRKVITLLCVVILIGLIYILMSNKKYKSYEQLDSNAKVTGIIIDNKIENKYTDQYVINVKSINGYKKNGKNKMILRVKKDCKTRIEYGDLVSFEASLEIANSQRNYGGFNYNGYLRQKKIYGILNSENINILKKEYSNKINIFINKVRLKINDNLERILGKENSKVCLGIMIGNTNDISDDIKDAFRKSSLTHMLAVSGAHVSYIIAGISLCVSKININKKIKNVIIIIILIFFAILTGGTPSVQRACIVACLVLISEIVYKQPDIVNNLSLAFIIIVLQNPYNICDSGMLMSFAGTIGIIYFHSSAKNVDNSKNRMEKLLIKIKQSCIVTISANLVILPISMYNYNICSLTFILSNLIASPILGIVIILGFSLFFISLISINIACFLGGILNIAIRALINICSFFSKLKISTIYVKTPSLISMITYYIFIFGIVYIIRNRSYIWQRKLYKKKKIFIIICCLIIITTNCNFINFEGFTIHFIDVGQGDSCLIKTVYNKNILIDGGGARDSSYDVGEKVLLPYLLDRGITKIDYVIITHFDSDHCQGLFAVLRNLDIKNVIISEQGEDSQNFETFKKIVTNKKIKVIKAIKGDKIRVEKNTYIEILWPETEQIKENILNNNSIVAKITYGKFSLLCTGDIEEIAEKEIVNLYKNKLKSTVLKVAHHGSKSSSIQEFLDKVQPKVALIGVGEKNTFGHPNDGVIKRLQDIKTLVYRTDLNGEITINVNKIGKYKVNTKIK